MYSNQAHDLYNDGSDVTVAAAKAVNGRTFATLTANTDDHNMALATTANTTSTVAGVFKYDANQGDLVGLARGASRVVQVTTDSPLTPGVEVQVSETGTATPVTDGTPIGYVFQPVDDHTAYVSLYH